MNWIQRQLKKGDDFMVGDIAATNICRLELLELRRSYDLVVAELKDYKILKREQADHIDRLTQNYRDMESKYNKTVGAMGSERTDAGMKLAEKDEEIARLTATIKQMEQDFVLRNLLV